MGEVIVLKYLFKLWAYYLLLILKENNVHSFPRGLVGKPS